MKRAFSSAAESNTLYAVQITPTEDGLALCFEYTQVKEAKKVGGNLAVVVVENMQ